MFRQRAKDPCPDGAETLARDSRTRRTNDVEADNGAHPPAGLRSGDELLLPAVASADTLDAAEAGVLPDSVAINSIWVVVAALLVIFMQAGFAFLEIGFSRGKNAGTVVAKILTNMSIAAICTGRSASPSRSATARDLIGSPGSSCATTVIHRRPSP